MPFCREKYNIGSWNVSAFVFFLLPALSQYMNKGFFLLSVWFIVLSGPLDPPVVGLLLTLAQLAHLRPVAATKAVVATEL